MTILRAGGSLIKTGGGQGRRVAAATRSRLTQSDLIYRGRFRAPNTGRNSSEWRFFSLCHRVVDGQFRLMGVLNRQAGYSECWFREFVPPTELDVFPDERTPPTVINEWRLTDIVTPISSTYEIRGFWVDPDTSHLYWTQQSGDMSYNNAVNQAVLGRSLWNSGTQTWTHEGRWSLGTAIGSKVTLGAFMEIPEWFRTQYSLGNKRIGAGMGSYRSRVQLGPASIGPALIAIAPPSTASLTDIGDVQELINYPSGVGAAQRDDDTAEVQGDWSVPEYWIPSGGNGVWGWNDWCGQSGYWIDTPTKSGILVIAAQTSVGGSGNGGVATMLTTTANVGTGNFTVTLNTPIIGLTVGDFVGMQCSTSGQNESVLVSSITDGGLTIGVSNFGLAAPVTPKVNGWLCKGTWYHDGHISSSMWRHKAYIYDPEDLGSVANGDSEPYEIQPAERWNWEVDGFDYPSLISLASSENQRTINGITFNPVTRMLYVLSPTPDSPTTTGSQQTIEVYEVAE